MKALLNSLKDVILILEKVSEKDLIEDSRVDGGKESLTSIPVY